jgi:hypothetical protein
MLLDWTAPSGAAYYSEYQTNGGDDRYTRPAPGLVGRSPVVLRGWDFGVRRPGVVFAQWDAAMRRLWVLREMMPGFWDSSADTDYGIDVRSFRDAVLFLSGQIGMDVLRERPPAMDLINRIAETPEYPLPPWFGNAANVRFVDFALGREVNRRLESEEQLLTYAGILAESGIFINEVSDDWATRETVMRELLTVRPDGWPGLILDPLCPILIRGLNGGIQYHKKTKLNSLPEKAARDGYFEHLHDCVNYIAVSVSSPIIHKESQQVAAPVMRNAERVEQIPDGVDFWIGGR